MEESRQARTRKIHKELATSFAPRSHHLIWTKQVPLPLLVKIPYMQPLIFEQIVPEIFHKTVPHAYNTLWKDNELYGYHDAASSDTAQDKGHHKPVCVFTLVNNNGKYPLYRKEKSCIRPDYSPSGIRFKQYVTTSYKRICNPKENAKNDSTGRQAVFSVRFPYARIRRKFHYSLISS
jgi:hypothetical protein